MTANHNRPVSNGKFVVREEEGLFAIDDTGNEVRICDAIWHLGNAVDDDGNAFDFHISTARVYDGKLPFRMRTPSITQRKCLIR